VSTRLRIFLAAILLIVLPLVGLSWVLRDRITARYTGEFQRRTASQLAGAAANLDQRARRIAASLTGIAEALQDDNRFRLAIIGGRDDLMPYLRDAAGRAMHLGGLQVLLILDDHGVILSSGHYRNEFGRHDHELVSLLQQSSWSRPDRGTGPVQPASMALASIRMPAGESLALLLTEPMRIGDHVLHVVGGEILDASLLAALSSDLADLALLNANGPMLDDPWFARHLPGLTEWADEQRLTDAMTAAGFLIRSDPLPLIRNASPAEDPASGGRRLSEARLVARVSTAPLRTTLREMNMTFGLALAAALAGAFGLAAWLSAQLSRPLQDLALKATRVDLDDPAVDLSSTRQDEVGRLARVLSVMIARLREDAIRLAAAEHRATLGEVARQVNHDLRNGLTPVRNILRHLRETAAAAPTDTTKVLNERLPTLDSSVSYLEELASRYARLAPRMKLAPCDLAVIAREASLGMPQVEVHAESGTPDVLADPVSLRRILDNLLSNAREALRAEGGRIMVRIDRIEDERDGIQCRLAVIDDGIGMTAEVAARSCEDFFTTRSDGTGLGLSNVRRLVGDAGGHLRIDSVPGTGTTVTVVFPAMEIET
jgi:signal transduction histidine kinase